MNFGLINRRVNPVIERLLHSRAHPILSSKLALITVTGRRSGRTRTFPVGYSETPLGVTIAVGFPEEKVWWRNLRSPAPVELLIAGVLRTGTGRAVESKGRVTVAVALDR
jgi:hypothetical protein